MKLRDRGLSTTTDAAGEYSISFRLVAFINIEIEESFTLGRCLVVEPSVLGFGTLMPGQAASDQFVVANDCDGEEVSSSYAPSMDPFTIEILHCSQPQGSGSLHAGAHSLLLGSGPRCQFRATCSPQVFGTLYAAFRLSGSDVPGSPVHLRMVAASTGLVHTEKRNVHMTGTKPSPRTGVIALASSPSSEAGLSFRGRRTRIG